MALEDRLIALKRMGQPALTTRELEVECISLEKRRSERKENMAEAVVPKRNIRMMQQWSGSAYDSDSEPELCNAVFDCVSSEDELPLEDATHYQLVHEVKQEQRALARKGKEADPKVLYKRAFRRYNNNLEQRKNEPFKHPPPKFPRKGKFPAKPFNARQAGGQQGQQPQHENRPPAGPPNRLPNDPERKISDLMVLANCKKGQCFQCGQPGHYMNTDRCPLKDKCLVDKPCRICKEGLHSADDCVRMYQSAGNGANLQANQVDQDSDEDLNED